MEEEDGEEEIDRQENEIYPFFTYTQRGGEREMEKEKGMEKERRRRRKRDRMTDQEAKGFPCLS